MTYLHHVPDRVRDSRPGAISWRREDPGGLSHPRRTRDYKYSRRVRTSLFPVSPVSPSSSSSSALLLAAAAAMDSFAEPRRHTTPVSLAAVREQVRKLEDDHKANGIPLSGRIIQVCHYLPVSSSYSRRRNDVPSPPPTPPTELSDIPASPTEGTAPSQEAPIEQPQPQAAPTSEEDTNWTLSVRYGHSAMVSGIASLSTTHEQIVIGWTGDITSAPTPLPPAAYGAPSTSTAAESSFAAPSKVPVKDIGEEDRHALQGLLAKYRSREDVEVEGGKPISYVPVWLDDKEAHGHYEGYCKQSESFAPLRGPFVRVLLRSLCHLLPTRLRVRCVPSRVAHSRMLRIWRTIYQE